MTDALERRGFLAGIGIIAGALAADATRAATSESAAPANGDAPAAQEPPTPYLVLGEREAQFLAAAVDTLIPADDLSPAASEVGVLTFIDRQLASAWGAGTRTYRNGPFQPGTPQQGYQSPMTPRDFIMTGIVAADEWVRQTTGSAFAALEPAARTKALQQIEAGEAKLAGMDGPAFFDALLQITMEGFFADPVYGGNRQMAGWRMLGFPGLPAFYAGEIEAWRGKRYEAPPKSIADFL